MIDTQTVEETLKKLSTEEAELRLTNDRVIREHQQRTAQVQEIANANASRIQQIVGAIAVLKQLSNGQKPPPTENKTK